MAGLDHDTQRPQTDREKRVTLNLNNFPPATIPDHAEALRIDVKAFIAEQLAGAPPHIRARTWSGFDAEFSRAMARRGWIGLTVPVEYGGAGLDDDFEIKYISEYRHGAEEVR